MAYQQLPPSANLTAEQTKLAHTTARKGAVGCGIVWLLFVAGFLLPGMMNGDFILPPLIIFGGIGLAIIGWGLLPTIRALKITAPETDLSRDAVRLGDGFDFHYQQTFKDRLDLHFARVSFFLRETATFRRGTDTYTEIHEIPVDEFVIPGRVFQPGEILDLSRRFTVPEDGMHTFVAHNNKIEWLVRVQVSILRWPDVDETYPIRVLAQRIPPAAEDH